MEDKKDEMAHVNDNRRNRCNEFKVDIEEVPALKWRSRPVMVNMSCIPNIRDICRDITTGDVVLTSHNGASQIYVLNGELLIPIEKINGIISAKIPVIFDVDIKYWSDISQLQGDKRVGANLRSLAPAIMSNVEIIDEEDEAILICPFSYEMKSYLLIYAFSGSDRYSPSLMLSRLEEYIYDDNLKEYYYVTESELGPELLRYMKEVGFSTENVLRINR